MKKNYLDKIPVYSEKITHKTNENGLVTLQIKNSGIINLFVQKLFGKPRTSNIRLDEIGSFVWMNIDGCRSIYDIAELLDEKFGKSSHPLYERITDFFIILDRNNFIDWTK